MRTADGRVETVLSRKSGYYAIKVDGEDKYVQRSYFASDQGALLKKVPDATKKKKKSGPPQDTPMRLRDKEGAIVGRTTMKAWSKESGLDVPKGYEDHHEIVVNVPKSWTTAKWSPSTGARKIHYATVDGRRVELAGTASTARGADNLHVLDIKKLKFRPRGEFRDYSDKNTIGTDARDDDPWKKGAATDKIGAGLRPRLEAVPVDVPELIVFASENCVGPATPSEQKRVAPGCFLASSSVANFGGDLRITFGGTTQAEANRAAGVMAIACALDHLKGKLDDSPIFNGLSDELKDAARKARQGEPWKDQNLDRYFVRVLSDREKAALDQYLEKCRRLGRTPRIGKTPVAPSEKSWDDANKREGRGRHSRVRLSVELEH